MELSALPALNRLHVLPYTKDKILSSCQQVKVQSESWTIVWVLGPLKTLAVSTIKRSGSTKALNSGKCRRREPQSGRLIMYRTYQVQKCPYSQIWRQIWIKWVTHRRVRWLFSIVRQRLSIRGKIRLCVAIIYTEVPCLKAATRTLWSTTKWALASQITTIEHRICTRRGTKLWTSCLSPQAASISRQISTTWPHSIRSRTVKSLNMKSTYCPLCNPRASKMSARPTRLATQKYQS